ncbi:hypothetical protein M011DRAFT_177895 [Sporormia fimetaria CBS 119925]|uniref:Uncharacterized protein n=1 Tax=Sporormia fimetaria CBS 119925 TaxID=1340428 RepID=A0A6A6VN59_9PLEO|nr:hypothetical protein M011DRAFT_177895 [Sporormia fimetaria CBS 119925]
MKQLWAVTRRPRLILFFREHPSQRSREASARTAPQHRRQPWSKELWVCTGLPGAIAALTTLRFAYSSVCAYVQHAYGLRVQPTGLHTCPTVHSIGIPVDNAWNLILEVFKLRKHFPICICHATFGAKAFDPGQPYRTPFGLYCPGSSPPANGRLQSSITLAGFGRSTHIRCASVGRLDICASDLLLSVTGFAKPPPSRGSHYI